MKKKKANNKPAGKLGTPAPIAGSPMNVNLLEQIVKLMTANDLNTVDVRDGEKRVILKRGAEVVSGPVSYSIAPQPSRPHNNRRASRFSG